MKVCNRCHQELDDSCFAFRQAAKDKLQNYCRKCKSVYASERLDDEDYAASRQAFDRERSKDPRRKAMIIASVARSQKRYPDHCRTRMRTGYLHRKGVYTRAKCQFPGCEEATKVHCHHPDYSDPTNFYYLCPKHHGRIHRNPSLVASLLPAEENSPQVL